MDKTTQATAIDAIRHLDADVVRARLADLESEERALRVILRACKERDHARQVLAPRNGRNDAR
jgi:hypothetical protein